MEQKSQTAHHTITLYKVLLLNYGSYNPEINDEWPGRFYCTYN